MMRRRGWFVFVFLCIMVLVIGALCLFGRLLDQPPAPHEPVTLEYLDRLAVDLNTGHSETPQPHVSGSAATALQTDAAQQQETEGVGIRDLAKALPKRLERAATPEERAQRWQRMEEGPVPPFLLDIALGMIDVVSVWTGEGEGAAKSRAMGALQTDDWSGARRHLEECLKKSRDPGTRRLACAYLSWLEDDPELAARYVELACSDEDLFNETHVVAAYDLAWTTGSRELTDYYWARLADIRRRNGQPVPKQPRYRDPAPPDAPPAAE